MENKEGCPIKSCIGKLLCTAVIAFVILFASGYVIHHIWLMPIYEQTASLWRPKDEVQALLPWLIAYYAVLSLVIAALFCKIKKAKMEAACAVPGEANCQIGGPNCPIKFGVCFGVIVGLLLGTTSASIYIWLPIPGELAVKWLIGWLVQGILIGVILSLFCHCCKKKG